MHGVERGGGRCRIGMVVPAIRVVVCNDHGGILPVWLLLQEVKHVGDKCLFIEWIGIARMRIADGGRLDVAYRGEVTCRHSSEEVIHVILMMHWSRCAVERIGGADHSSRAWTGMRWILRSRIILEPGMVRHIVRRVGGQYTRIRTALAAICSVGVDGCEIEAAHETTPGDVLGIQQVADVLVVRTHLHEAAGGGRRENVTYRS